MGGDRALRGAVILALGLLCVGTLAPLMVLAGDALEEPVALLRFLGEERNRQSWWMSLRLSVAAALIATLLALLLGVLTTRTDLPGRAALAALACLPLALPSYILAMAWLRLWQPRSGALQPMGLSWDISGPTGCALVLGLAELPIVFLPVQAALQRADPSLEEAARMAGASPARALWDATVRPAIPSVATGAALAASSALAAFGVPLLLGTGGTEPFSVLTTRIYEQLLVGTPAARSQASSAAVWLAITSGLFTLLAARAARRVAWQAQGKPGRPRLMSLGRGRWATGILAWLLMGILLIAPLCALSISSLQPFPNAPFTDWSLQAHELLLKRRGLLAAVARSAELAACAAIICVVLAVCLGVLAHRRGMRSAAWASSVLSWPYVLPGSVLALGLLLTLARPLRVVIGEQVSITVLVAGTPWMLLFAYVLKHAAVSVRPLAVALKGIGVSLDEAARIAGAAPWRAFVTGTAHALWPYALGALFTGFLLCFSELTLSVLLVGPDTEVVGTVLFELHSYASPSESAALASWMAMLALLLFFIASRRQRP
jgi:iron(III) transport system permease protein